MNGYKRYNIWSLMRANFYTIRSFRFNSQSSLNRFPAQLHSYALCQRIFFSRLTRQVNVTCDSLTQPFIPEEIAYIR